MTSPSTRCATPAVAYAHVQQCITILVDERSRLVGCSCVVRGRQRVAVGPPGGHAPPGAAGRQQRHCCQRWGRAALPPRPGGGDSPTGRGHCRWRRSHLVHHSSGVGADVAIRRPIRCQGWQPSPAPCPAVSAVLLVPLAVCSAPGGWHLVHMAPCLVCRRCLGRWRAGSASACPPASGAQLQ